MKPATALALSLFVAASIMRGLWAQSPQGDVFRHPLKPENLNAFSLTCARLANHPFIKGNFEQEKILNRLNRSLKSSGNFVIAAELGMIWDTTSPFPSTLVLGNDYLIQSRPGGQKTVMSAQGNETFIRLAEVISTVFSGHARGLLDNFEVFYFGNAAAWELGLFPLHRAIGSFAERIVMKGDTAIRYIEIHEKSGDIIKYILSNHSYPTELNVSEKALFSFP
ncbi:MAG: outer membrane lipoprotein carrier protein LolA [Treponema sp.]|nr:outer membrane lipoprotein carrier protein LolA [Treponema sp.]